MTYWMVAVALIFFGFLAGFSIGQPILFIGLVMLVLGPMRSRRRVFWPLMSAAIAFVVGVMVVAPVFCTVTEDLAADRADTTVCSSVIGIRYSGGAGYNPSLLPSIAAGLTLAAVDAVVVAVATRRRAT